MLKAADYPPDKWPFLLRLMSLFQLAFPLDEDGVRQLVPALLPAEAPTDAKEPEGEDRLRLRYEFTVVPAPLIPRLLVRSFSLIRDALHWRRGAIFTYGPARAKVWSTTDERWVYATIAGEEKARGALTRIIRGSLARLFAEYKNLQVIEQVEWKGSWVPRAALEHLDPTPEEEGEGVPHTPV